MSTSTSLLQDVLRPHAFGIDKINSKLAAASLDGDGNSPPSGQAVLDDSDDELVGVVRLFSHCSLLACLISTLRF